ncbi:hypothetical protein E7Y31_08870 [Candidatus Frankia alpina]|uniref:Uncharacterized protein n=1 Tax=Candidatus Frankia alpina TaxID=2699483 RepID=A0A4S5ES32_9ACTN|nr:hypothetical protein E7Y31_08870 [Candidatus Frankia alpina]
MSAPGLRLGKTAEILLGRRPPGGSGPVSGARCTDGQRRAGSTPPPPHRTTGPADPAPPPGNPASLSRTGSCRRSVALSVLGTVISLMRFLLAHWGAAPGEVR